jgi:hypothetical protein
MYIIKIYIIDHKKKNWMIGKGKNLVYIFTKNCIKIGGTTLIP